MVSKKGDGAQPQPQPQPQPVAPPQPPVPQAPATIPGIQNVMQYLAIGPQGQLYAYDINLAAWGIANSKHMESIMAASGIPPQTLQAIRNVVGGRG